MSADSLTPPAADRRHAPTWATGAKDGVGTSADARSRVWFTIARGILTEIFFPRVDCANTRDMRFVITAAGGYFADESLDADTLIDMLEPGIPAYRIRKRFRDERCDLEKIVVSDPDRSTVLQRVRLVRGGGVTPLRLHVLLAPHVGNHGDHNDGWGDEYKGVPMLFARRGDSALALAASVPLRVTDCGYAGDDDAWHELRRSGRLTGTRTHAMDGNLLLAAELDMGGDAEEAIVAIAFGVDHHAAAAHARASLARGFTEVLESYVSGWKHVHAVVRALGDAEAARTPALIDEYRASITVLRVHEDKAFPGGLIASFATPWGAARDGMDEGGYHLVWPRDAVEIAGGLLAAGLEDSALRALLHLMSTQEAAGNWPQNMWLNGRAYWHGVQLDEAALPVLLADLLQRHDALGAVDPWPMIRRAASYLVANGPATPQDRWEREGGYSPFTLAVEIAALLIAADFADRRRELRVAGYLRETADYWHDSIERWTYCTDDALTRRLGIEGYYARKAGTSPLDEHGRYAARERTHPRFARHNPAVQRRGKQPDTPASVISVDALALVRFGVRRPNDPRIADTIRAIDASLKSETTTGPVWHRFAGDTYGESADGSNSGGDGIGRGWPLLTGERAHYELSRGDVNAARALRCAMMRQVGECGMFPEQVWDAADIADRRLYNGRPTGSAMPLAWAHAEFIKLCRSLDDGTVFDMPELTVRRYIDNATSSPLALWRDDARITSIRAGKRLRVETFRCGTVEYLFPDNGESGVCAMVDTGLGVHVADIPTERLERGAQVRVQVRIGEARNELRTIALDVTDR